MFEAAAQTRAILKAHRRIARAIDLHSRRVERVSGLTLAQLVVLGCARDLGESATTKAIAAEADISDATVVAMLEKLEMKGLVERERSRVDRRVVHTRLTPAGEQALAAAPPVLGEGFSAAFAVLDPADRQRLAGAFTRIADLAAPAPAAARVQEAGDSTMSG
jgi:DNA-binding MarR family transcriptional regulator